MRKNLKIGLITFSTLLFVFCGYVYLVNYHPDDILTEPVYNGSNPPALTAGKSIKVLSWNIQFLAGNENNYFFFEGGADPWPAKEIIDQTLSEVVRILKDENPDLILLQEVDDGSKRTFNEDQLDKILRFLPDSLNNHTSTFYWKSCYILHPAIMGSAGMKLSIISKYKIKTAIRYALSPITTDNIIIRQFNPKRAMLEAYLPINNGKNMRVINTHLSAFAQGSNTMEKQIAQVNHLLEDIENNGELGFVAGDFNLIPPGQAYGRLSDFNKSYYNPKGTEIAPLFQKYDIIPTLSDLNGSTYKEWYTNMAVNANPKVPDKTIDYYIFANGIKPDTSYVRSKDTIHISDHLPLIVKITIPD